MGGYSEISFADVDIDHGFWQERQRMNREVTVYAVKERFEETGRFEALACRWKEGQPNRPHIFWDSDIAKWIESVAYLIRKKPMPDLEDAVELLIDLIGKQQTEDGYINSYFNGIEPTKRFVYRERHELYCAGHLIEAAVAWNEATGRDRFLKIMCRYADHIYRVFAEEQSAAFATPGHEEIELALVKLYHATGEKRYLELSRYFVDQRGSNDRDPEAGEEARRYGQYHLPVRQQETAEGHAVRACYLYSAMADLAREYDDKDLENACRKIFDNIVSRRMYITSGIGSTHNGEAFTRDYDLPNETAYSETCASIALALFAHRMTLLEPDGIYADTVERVLYNTMLSGVSLDGSGFFYTNPLEIRAARRHGPEKTDWLPITQRVKVFECSCCPPNETRILASLGNFMLTQSPDCIFLHQYFGASVKTGGMGIRVSTDYPRSGRIQISVSGMKQKTMALRIPGWCGHFTLDREYRLEKGYAYVTVGENDTLELDLEMKPVLIGADPRVSENCGKAAVMRGPVVYCMEGVDNGEELFDCRLDADAVFEETEGPVKDVPSLKTRGWRHEPMEEGALYRPYRKKLIGKDLTLIPYFAFANRGETDMLVWIPIRE